MGSSPPIAFTIRREGSFSLDIALVETKKLLLHEETIPEMLRSLTLKIGEDGVLRAPVIVDRETMVVLDGMHRVEALRGLGCWLTCVCLVDYSSPEIKVERWCRAVSNPFDAKAATDMAAQMGLRLTPRESRGAFGAAGSSMIFKGSSYELSSPGMDLLTLFKAVRELELKLRDSGFKVSYETDVDAMEMLVKGNAGAVICPPRIGKRHVLETALQGRVFVFKATRHIIPARPLGVDVSLSLLRDTSLSVEEANEKLSAILRRKQLRHLPPGTALNGRRYDEDLYVFEDA